MSTEFDKIKHICSNVSKCTSTTCAHRKLHLPEHTAEGECYQITGCYYHYDSICVRHETDWDT